MPYTNLEQAPKMRQDAPLPDKQESPLPRRA